MNYLLFTTTTCPRCPAVKKFVADNFSLPGRTVDNTDPEFMDLAGRYGVSVAPTLLVFDEGGAQVLRANEVGEIEYWLQSRSDA